MTGIVKSEQNEIITPEKISEYMNVFGIAANLTDIEKRQFTEIATAYQLNPFKREIYCIPYMSNVQKPDGTWEKERKLSIITGYETYLKRAERLGRLNGWNVQVAGDGDKRVARITIHRKDWEHPFTHDVHLSEYKENNKMWKEKPMTMLKKVAMAQGFRLAFPDEMGGLPYAEEELPDTMTKETKLPEPSSPPPPDVTPDALKNNKGEIELENGDHKETMKRLGKCRNEIHIQTFLKLREKRIWTGEELKEQDNFISILRDQWKAEADAAKNMK
ncbi:MAG: phage recombination protein Bet [Spirochaetae bacterium HGW-Spirochaetae-5]|nr:MAG: phage recombination protein Bet [Spirochaetae bacterium HGW-Spirochaetae-5]